MNAAEMGMRMRPAQEIAENPIIPMRPTAAVARNAHLSGLEG